MKKWLLVVIVSLFIISMSGLWTVSGITSPPPPPPIDPPPSPIEFIKLTATPKMGYAPFAVTFQLTSVYSLSEITWNFGDGSPDQYGGTTVTHTYSSPGSYNAIVTAVCDDDIYAEAGQKITVMVANHPPSVVLTASPTSGLVPLTVNFTAYANDPDGDVMSYTWDFGDGSPGEWGRATMSHIYQNAGTYNARVTVRDEKGGSASAQQTITTRVNHPPAIITLAAGPPTGKAPLNVTFSAQASDPDGDALSYNWNFGDNSPIQPGGAAISHIYQNPGTYNASVTVADPYGGVSAPATTKIYATVRVTKEIYGPVGGNKGNYNNSNTRTGDFNGDGKTDFLIYGAENNNWVANAYLGNDGINYTDGYWADQQGEFKDAQKWYSGDFNGDGKTDMAKFWNDNGTWTADVHLSSGYNFSQQRWATAQGGCWDAQKWYTGDFNGDGKMDFAKFWNENNLWTADVHLSTGSSFVIQRWATGQGGYSDSMKWFTGDFNGDGKTDFGKLWNDGGFVTVDIHISTGSSFVMQRWATRQGSYSESMKWFTGDFNGDGLTDLAKFWGENGNWTVDVHLSKGTSFMMQRWATQQGGYWEGQQWFVGDFNGDGATDFTKFWASGQSYWADVHRANPAAGNFTMQRWVTDSCNGYFEDVRKWFPGDFNGDGQCDLIHIGSWVHSWRSYESLSRFISYEYNIPGYANMTPYKILMNPNPGQHGVEESLSIRFRNEGSVPAKHVYVEIQVAGLELPTDWGGCGLVSYNDSYYVLRKNIGYADAYDWFTYMESWGKVSVDFKAYVRSNWYSVSILARVYSENDAWSYDNEEVANFNVAYEAKLEDSPVIIIEEKL
ncbi:MAG TPA: PKD domain-containing protein [Bacillota bacterium]|nr:PKD domain-containing protein [Bacillota bacterium]